MQLLRLEILTLSPSMATNIRSMAKGSIGSLTLTITTKMQTLTFLTNCLYKDGLSSHQIQHVNTLMLKCVNYQYTSLHETNNGGNVF